MNVLVERTPSGRYILRFNASLLKESNCMRKVWFTLFRGLVPQGGDTDFKMDYGTAFHKAMFLHYSGRPLQDCTQAAFESYSKSIIPESDWRSVSHLLNCVMQYIGHYKKEGDLIVPDKVDGKPMLEMSFQYPLITSEFCDVLLCGTIDFKGIFANAYKVIVDHKTTSLTYPDTYLNSYVLSPQLMTYKMVHQWLFPGEPIQCLINGIFLNRTNKNTFKRSLLIDFTDDQMAKHKFHLYEVVHKIVNNFERMVRTDDLSILDAMFNENYTCCDQKYGMCQFLPLCLAHTREDQEGIIQISYAQRLYDPSKFQA